MASAGSLIFEIAADVSRLNKGLKEATDNVNKSLDSISTKLTANLAADVAQMAVQIIRGVSTAVKGAIDEADKLGKLSQSIGMQTKELSQLAAAAEYSNVNVDDLAKGMKSLDKAMIDTTKSGSNANKAFAALGIETKGLSDRNPSDVLNEVADAFKKSEDGAAKAAIAQQLFGRNSQAMIPFLNQGSQAINDLKTEAEAMGNTVDDKTAAAAGAFNDQLTKMAQASKGGARSLAADLLPGLTSLAESFVSSVREGGLFKLVLDGIGIAMKAVISVVIALNEWLSLTVRNFSMLAKAFKQAISGDFSGAWNTLKKGGEDVKSTMATIADRVKAVWVGSNAPVPQATAQQQKLNYTLANTPKAAKTAKAGVDEYAKSVASLNEQYRILLAGDNELAKFQATDKFASFTKAEQDNLTVLKQREITLKTLQEEEKQYREEQMRRIDDQVKADKAAADSLWDYAQAVKDQFDPVRELQREQLKATQALEAGYLKQGEYIAKVTANVEEYKAKLADPATVDKFKELTDAINAFGKDSASMFIDFISGADGAQQSFSELVASMLRDIAKMLLYENVFKGLFGWMNKGFTNFLSDVGIGGLSSGGGKSAGGNVYPGQVYTVNESPFRREQFIPTVPGYIDNGFSRSDSGGVQINITMMRDGTAKTDSEKGKDDNLMETGRRMAAAVRRVLVDEKRPGGLLA